MKRKALGLRILVVLVLAVMAGRLAWIQVVKADEIIARDEEYRLQQEALMPVRGALLDRAGRTLAVSVPVRNVVANALQIKEVKETAEKLGGALGIDPAAIQRQLTENAKSGFIPLAKGIDLPTAQKIEQMRLEGISLLPGSVRTYPQGSTANQVIGYIDAEGHGEYGLEAAYDEKLAGKTGYVKAELTHTGVPIEGTVKSMVPPEPGLDAVLTLDTYLQQTFDARLDQAVKENEAKRAMAMAIDIQTGEILAMSMRPGADPGDRKTWVGADGKVDFNRITNWAVSPVPPGSIFKTITTSIALEEHLIDLNTLIADGGKITIDGQTIYNWDMVVPPTPEPKTIAQLLQVSSNVGLIQVGQKIPKETWERYMQRFGFMEPTGLDFSHEENATGLENFEAKQKIDWANMYIGQHLEVTPIQMLTAGAAIANGGKLVQPHLVKELRNPAGEVVWTAPTAPRRTVISEATAKEVQSLMVSVIQDTASLGKVDGYVVGGKTGTAQKFENGRMKERMLADFIGFAPASNPRVMVMIIVDEPKGSGLAGMVAAPVFRDLMPHVLRTMGIPPEKPTKEQAQAAQTKPVETVRVPDVRFMPEAWAQQRLRDAGLAMKVSGDGDVLVAMTPGAGGFAKNGSAVEVKRAKRTEGQTFVPDFRGLTLVEASRLAAEVGLTLKQGSGNGFVVTQDLTVGKEVPASTTVTVTLSPTKPTNP